MRESEALYLAHGYAIIAETCDVELIDIAIETLTKLRNNLVKLRQKTNDDLIDFVATVMALYVDKRISAAHHAGEVEGAIVMADEHTHVWALVGKYDSKAPKPERPRISVDTYSGGLFGGGYTHVSNSKSMDEIRHDIIDSINKSYEPTYTSETWACECGERKTNYHEEPSPMERLRPKKEQS
jgi:hypothetical protein